MHGEDTGESLRARSFASRLGRLLEPLSRPELRASALGSEAQRESVRYNRMHRGPPFSVLCGPTPPRYARAHACQARRSQQGGERRNVGERGLHLSDQRGLLAAPKMSIPSTALEMVRVARGQTVAALMDVVQRCRQRWVRRDERVLTQKVLPLT